MFYFLLLCVCVREGRGVGGGGGFPLTCILVEDYCVGNWNFFALLFLVIGIRPYNDQKSWPSQLLWRFLFQLGEKC